MSRVRRKSFAMKHMIHNDDENDFGSPDRMFSSKKLEPIRSIQSKGQKHTMKDKESLYSSAEGSNKNLFMHGKVSETLKEIKRGGKREKGSWWDVVRFWVTSGFFGSSRSDAGIKLTSDENRIDNNDNNGNSNHGCNENNYHSRKSNNKKSSVYDVDFDEEGRKILASKLGLVGGIPLPGDKGGNDYDALYRSPKGGGIIYVGNDRTAKSRQVLRKLGISRIINCTHGDSQLPNYHQPSTELIYMNFQICYWEKETKGEDDKLLKFFGNVFTFIDVAISNGKNVLIHCLAGAHRAGATAIACLMHYTNMDVKAAIAAAKTCRPIIDPISHLATLINSFGRARSNRAMARSVSTVMDSRQNITSSNMNVSTIASLSSPNLLSGDRDRMGYVSKSFDHESYRDKSIRKKKDSRHARYTYDTSPINEKKNITTLVPLIGTISSTDIKKGDPILDKALIIESNGRSKYSGLHDELSSPDILNKRRLARNKRLSF